MQSRDKYMDREKMQNYADEIRQFVMEHTEDVLKNPRSFIRYPFIDPGSVYEWKCVGLGYILVCIWIF